MCLGSTSSKLNTIEMKTIKYAILLNFTIVYMASTFQNDIIICLKMVAIKLNPLIGLLKLSKYYPNDYVSLKYAFNGNKEKNKSFNQIEIQMVKFSMLTTVKKFPMFRFTTSRPQSQQI